MNDQEAPAAPGRAFHQSREFDANRKERILNLLLLKNRCHELDEALMASFSFNGRAMSFYTAITGVIDTLLFALINEEAVDSQAHGGPVGELLRSVAEDALFQGLPASSFANALRDVESLYQERSEFVLGSITLDFVVSTYSAFEMFLAKVYDSLRAEHPSTNSNAKKQERLIAKYNEASEADRPNFLSALAKINDFVPGRQKIEFVLSKLPATTWRDRESDRQAVQFYSNTRNSVHNLGKSGTSNDAHYSGEGIELTHNAGAALYTDDRSDVFRLCGLLVEIYAEVVEHNRHLAPEAFLEVGLGFLNDSNGAEVR